MTDIVGNLGQQRLAGEKARHVHRYQQRFQDDGPVWICMGRFGCGRVRDEARARAGRSARRRGNRRELELARALGGEKVGMYGGPTDVRAGLFNVQSKTQSLARFPTWMTTELAKLPRTDGAVPVLIVTAPPGLDPGDKRKRLAIVVLALDDWRDLHGEP